MHTPQALIRFGVFQVDLPAGELRRRNVRVKLQQQPFRALVALLERPGEVVTREELRKRLWPDDTVGDFDRSLNKTIARVRDALGDDADNPRFIETLPQRGYRFLAPVETGSVGPPAVSSGPQTGEALVSSPAPGEDRPAGVPLLRRRAGVAVLALLVVAGVIAVRRHSSPVAIPNPTASTVRFRLPVPEGVKLSDTETFSLSPDGRTLVYLGIKDGRRRLWSQSLDALEPRSLPDTENPDELIFWSPDSKHLFFPSGGKLRTSDLSGSPTQALGQLAPVGASVNSEGTIIFGTETSGIQRIDPKRGKVTAVTVRNAGERVQIFPSFLPDGRHFIYSRISSIAANTGIFIGSLDAEPGEQSPTRLIASTVGARFVPSGSENGKGGNGTILFQRETTLWAQDFDTSRLQLTGQPRLVAEPVGSALAYGFFSASQSTLVYRNGVEDVQLTWFDRHGQPLAKLGQPASFFDSPMISPDGLRVAASIVGSESTDIWVHDVARDVLQRITSDPAIDRHPAWSPDGKRLVFSSARSGHYDLYEISAGGDGHERVLYASNEDKAVTSLSPDGRFVLYTAQTGSSAQGIWALPLDTSNKSVRTAPPIAWTHGLADEGQAVFSPDSRWIAFVSNESGRGNVYAKPFSGEGPKIMVSRDGGSMPHWRADGKEILYTAPDGTLMSAAVTASNPIRLGAPQSLFHLGGDLWDATSDGNRFLVEVPVQQGVPPFTVVLNWQVKF